MSPMIGMLVSFLTRDFDFKHKPLALFIISNDSNTSKLLY